MRRVVFGVLGLCCSLLFLVSCEQEPPLSDGKMEDLVVEFLLTEQCAPYPAEDTTRMLNLYADIYARAGVDSLRVDSAFRYYAAHPERLDVILDRVIARMQREFDSLNAVRPEEMMEQELRPVDDDMK